MDEDLIYLVVYILQLAGVSLFPICRIIAFIVLKVKIKDQRSSKRFWTVCTVLEILFILGGLTVAILAKTDPYLDLAWALIPVDPEPSLILACIGVAIVLLGCALLIAALVRLVKSSMTREIKYVVRTGPYRYVRHPIHLSFFIYIIGSLIARLNWFFTLLVLIGWSFGTIALIEEERQLLAKFGKEYFVYKNTVGHMWPCTCCDWGISKKKANTMVESSVYSKAY